jgi:hypothetical protein
LVGTRGGAFDAPDQLLAARDQIAKRIIAMAQRGERDPAAPEAAAAETADETRPAQFRLQAGRDARNGRLPEATRRREARRRLRRVSHGAPRG